MIPRTFHRIWLDEPVPARFEAYWQRLRELHPDWEFVTWDDSGALDWLQNLELFRSFRPEPASYALRADVLRYEVLNRYGGVYVDTDVEPLRPFDDLLEDPRPFIGWCSDKELDPAVIASPPGHPAIRQLVDDLAQVREWARGRPRLSPPGTTGPFYVTNRWQGRSDVRRLPPVAFFPYHWSKMAEGHPPWPAESYAVHHWNAGWKVPRRKVGVAADVPAAPRSAVKAVPRSNATTPASALVAFRDADGTRTRLWDFVRQHLETQVPELEIVVSSDDDEDPFHKTLAINRAAQRASRDIFVIWDADTWIGPQALRAALNIVAADRRVWMKPYITKQKLNEAATEHLLDLGSRWDGSFPRGFGSPEKQTTFAYGPPLVLSREAFEAVGGMDERFRGWGAEDEAFGLALACIVRRQRTGIPATAMHLWHTRRGRSGQDLWLGQADTRANDALLQRYRHAKTAAAMREVIGRMDAEATREVAASA